MTGVQLQLTDEDKELITQRFREIAQFADGDRVTVEPTDHDIAYAGRELEGALLTVDDVFWNSNNLAYPTGNSAPEHSRYDDAHYVELQGEYEHYQHDSILLTNVEYGFKERGTHHMSESGLIPWEEYREDHDRIKLLNESPSDNETHWLEPFEENCEVCGCNMAKHWYYSNGVQNAGGVSCAGCGDVKERHGP